MANRFRKDDKVYWGTRTETGFGFFTEEFKSKTTTGKPFSEAFPFPIKKGEQIGIVENPRGMMGKSIIPLKFLKSTWKKLPRI